MAHSASDLSGLESCAQGDLPALDIKLCCNSKPNERSLSSFLLYSRPAELSNLQEKQGVVQIEKPVSLALEERRKRVSGPLIVSGPQEGFALCPGRLLYIDFR